MKGVVVFGSNGMLGRAVIEESESRHYIAYKLPHAACEILDKDQVIRALYTCAPALVINCAGSIPQRGPVSFPTNAVGPRVVSQACQELNIPFLHVSTDCVFSGKLPYPEAYSVISMPDPVDEYGQSKAEGELIPYGTVVRTSFIGHQHGLLPWLLSSKAQVPGWLNAWWSGSSVYEVARSLLDMSLQDLPSICHLATEAAISKDELLVELVDAFQLPVRVVPQPEPQINRRLVPTYTMRPVTHFDVMQELVKKVP